MFLNIICPFKIGMINSNSSGKLYNRPHSTVNSRNKDGHHRDGHHHHHHVMVIIVTTQDIKTITIKLFQT